MPLAISVAFIIILNNFLRVKKLVKLTLVIFTNNEKCMFRLSSFSLRESYETLGHIKHIKSYKTSRSHLISITTQDETIL